MPLIKSKSKRAFQENVKKELASGRPLKQSLAIAYSVKREAEAKERKSSVKGRPANRSMRMPKRKTK